MATIKQRGDGWFVQIRRKNFPPQYRTFDRKPDAEEWARKTEAEMDASTWQDNKKARQTSFVSLLLRYAKEEAPKKRAGVGQTYKLNMFAERKAFAKPVSAITPQDIAAYRDERIKAGYTASTIRTEMSVLSMVFKHAKKEWGFHTLGNPAAVDTTTRPSLPPEASRTRTGTAEEVAAVLSNSQSSFLVPFVWLLLETACRRSDLTRLRWENVDLESETPTAYFADTKNKEPREIPLSPRACQILKGLPTPHNGPVFKSTDWPGPSKDDDGSNAPPLPADSVTQAWIRARNRASVKSPGLATLRLHDHRHTSITALVHDTILNQLEVAAISGHKDLRSLNRYFNGDAKKASRKLGWNKASHEKKEAAGTEAANKVPAIRVRKEGSLFIAFCDTPDGPMEAEAASPKEAKVLLLELVS